jgi:hypothetical protein
MFNSLAVRSSMPVCLAKVAACCLCGQKLLNAKLAKKITRRPKEKLASAMIVANVPANVRMRFEDNG